MKAEEFVSKMNSIDFLIRDEDVNTYSQDYLTKLANSYKIFANTEKIEVKDQILQLIQNHDVSKVEIGSITFNIKPIEEEDYIFIGKYEIDDLAISKKTNKILVKENRINHILSECADNSEKFLDAIYEAAKYLASVPLSEDVSDDPNVCKVSMKCADLAGSQNYGDFYKMFLGCYE